MRPYRPPWLLVIYAFIFGVLVGSLLVLCVTANAPSPIAWISWSENVTVEDRAFHIHDRGPHGDFGGVKFDPQLSVEKGQWICVSLKATHGIRPYRFNANVYYGRAQALLDLGPDRRRCYRAKISGDLYKVHVVGHDGFGGVRVEPTVTVGDRELWAE